VQLLLTQQKQSNLTPITPTNQATNQSISQPTSQSINQSANQPTNQRFLQQPTTTLQL